MSGGPHRVLGARVRAALAALAALALLAASPLPAQQSPRWEFRSDAFTDLWYHGLAVAGEQGPGPLAMYASAGPRRAVTGQLSDAAAAVHAGLRRDSTLEVLHFVPLHLAGTDPRTTLPLLGAILRGNPTVVRAPERVREVATAVAAALSPRARPVAAAFVDALLAEFAAGFGAEWRSPVMASARSGANRALQSRWDAHFVPVLREFIARHAGSGSLVIVSPAVGAEGRVMHENPSAPSFTIVGHLAGASEGPLLALTRELTFPVVASVLRDSPQWVPPDRATAARLSHTMATRAGAMLLEDNPLLATKYDSVFLGAAGRRGPLRDAFPLEPALELRLRKELTGRLDTR